MTHFNEAVTKGVEEFEKLLLDFLVQQLAWEKSEKKDILRGSPVLQEIAEKKYNNLQSFLHTFSQSLKEAVLDDVREAVPTETHSNAADRGDDVGAGYDIGWNACRQSLLTKLEELK